METRTCPHCLSEIPYEATCCKYCTQYSLNDTVTAENKRKDSNLNMGCALVVVFVFIMILVLITNS